jgi:microsomal dipeptidase-like Zn-dependent dipeptidase
MKLRKQFNRKVAAVSLLTGVTVASPAHAGWFDDAIDWVEGAYEDTVDWVEGAAETVVDTFEDFVNTVENIGTWFTGEENVVGYYPSADENPVHSLAQQCFSIQSPVTGKYFRLHNTGGIIDDGLSYKTDALDSTAAARFFFKPSSMGNYLMRDANGRYLAGIIPGEMTAGTYAGEFAEFETTAHEQADGTYLYRFHMTGLDRPMRNNFSTDTPYFIDPLNPGDANSEPYFKLVPNTGCAEYPEITTNVAGDPENLKGDVNAPVRGFIDPHTHITSYEFMGGKFMAGAPFSRWGVQDALRDSSDKHGPDGALDIIGNLQAYGDVNFRYDTRGYPDFPFWPNADQLSHMGYYYKWMERAWLGGQKMIVTHLVENEVLCNLQSTVNPASWIDANSCNTMESIELQVNRMREMQEYIDAQAGGRGKGFFRVVTSPEEARQVIADGKLAVVLGVEASEVMNCGEKDVCSYADVDYQLDKLYSWGVRALFPVHKFDNRLGGSVLENGLMNIGEWMSTGHFFRAEQCDAETEGEYMTSGFPEIGNQPVIGPIINELVPETPVYDESTQQCNQLGLTALGEYLIHRMIDKKMLIEMDHMSTKAGTSVLDIAQERGYSGMISSHSWMPDSNDGQLHYNMKRLIQMGGFVSPYNSDAYGMTAKISKYLDEIETTPYLHGVGVSTDMSGLGGQADPRYDGATNPLQYPFTTEFGMVVDKQVSGNRTFDISTEGMAHYGLLADHLQDIRVNGTTRVYEAVMNSAEAYLQMWERAEANTSESPIWRRWDGGLKQGSMGVNGEVWGVSYNDQIWRRVGASWVQMPGALSHVSVGDANNVWGVSSNGQIWRWNGSNWNNIPGGLTMVSAASDGTVWGRNSAGNVYYWNGNWNMVSGNFTYVSAGSATNVWAVNANGQVYKWDGSSFVNQYGPGTARVVEAAADGTVWALAPDNTVMSLASDGSWDIVGGTMTSLSIGNANQAIGTQADYSIWTQGMENASREFVSEAANKCMNIWGGSTYNGASIALHECVGTIHDDFTYEPDTGLIRSVLNWNYCLALTSGINAGSTVHLWECIQGHPDETFDVVGKTIIPRAYPTHAIHAWGTGHGADVGIAPIDGTAAQNWIP